MKQIAGNIVDIHLKKIYPGVIFVENEQIVSIEPNSEAYLNYILPGLVDAHVHIESSMLVPSEFSRIAVSHGTVATVSDPHEIANVLGVEGVKFMIENGREAVLKFNWAAPSCVPATEFETSGASIQKEELQELFKLPEIVALAEMMNFPGVVFGNDLVFEKLSLAKSLHFPIDGHAPGLLGDHLLAYINAGITTDHECSTLEEALEKIEKGMKILIRNGSSAKNFDALAPIIDQYPDKVMLCCDDIHPEDLLVGHINLFLKRGIELGLNIFNLVTAASLNPAKQYGLNVGCLKVGDKADLCVVDNLKHFNISETWIDGTKVYDINLGLPKSNIIVNPINNFCSYPVLPDQLQIKNEKKDFRVIEVLDGELLTKNIIISNLIHSEYLEPSIKDDILKIVVVNRYTKANPAVAFVKGFGLRSGAIASSVAHDSHNIVAIGTNDTEISNSINILTNGKGGIAVVNGSNQLFLSLPIAGLMSDKCAEDVAESYFQLNTIAKELGSTLKSPFMTMSFLALLVIPELKLSDKGLFDGNRFAFTSLFV